MTAPDTPTRWADGAPWWERRRHPSARIFRAVVAGIVQLPIIAALWWRAGAGAAVLFGVCAAVLVAAVLAPRRVAGPAAVIAAAAAALPLGLVWGGPPTPLLAFVLALVGAMLHARRAWGIVAAALAIAWPLGWIVVGSATGASSVAAGFVGSLTATGVAVAIAFIATEAVRARRSARRAYLASAADRRAAVAEAERVRIARELHDVLAHSLSSINVQAGVGLHLAGSRPDAAVEALETIKTASKDALDEVRSVLGVLRGDGEAAPRRPEPDLAAVPALVADAAGVTADLDDRLDPRPAPAVQFALYRLVQEALTNATRHATGAAATVVLERDGSVAVARVRDRRPGRVAPAAASAGRGLLGMRERAALLGGTLETVQHPDGFEIVARIPDGGS